jgi:competence protein ComEC
MGIILIYGRMRGQEYNALYGLLLAFVIIVTISPLALRYDTGLHLSVLATFGILTWTPYFQSKIKSSNKFTKLLREIATTTFGATLMTIPYITYKIGILSILGIFVNLIIVPLVPVLMFLGFMSGLTTGIHSSFGFIPSYSTNIVANIMTGIIEKVSLISWSYVYIKQIPFLLVFVLYLFLFYKGFKLAKSFS